MKKFFTFFLALATSVGMSWAATEVVITQNDFPENGSSLTKEGVTITAGMFEGGTYNIQAFSGGSFASTVGNFTQIEIEASYVDLEKSNGWTGNYSKMTWTGDASSVSFKGMVEADGGSVTITCTIADAPAEPYTFYFHPNKWTYDKYAVQSWSTDYEASVYSEFMTPVAGHEGWFSTSVPDGNSNLYVVAYPSEATTPTEGWVDFSWQLSDAGTYTYYYNNVGYMEDFDCRLTDGRILSGNILYTVDEDNLTAEVAYDQSPVAPAGELIIPSSFTWKTTTYTVTSIYADAYWLVGITSVSLPNTLLHIGNTAFHSSGLTSVTIPSSVTSIDDGAFALCGNLSSVTLEEGLTALGTQMFQYDHNLTEIKVPNSITELPTGVFSYCEGLRSVTLGTGVDTIGSNAFGGSNSLARLTIYAPAPPKVNLGDNPELVSSCVLMVPSSVKAAYEAHPYWSQFTIKGIYIVTFKDKDGNTIKAEAVEEGQSATAPDAPEVGCYTFNRWDEDFSDVHADLEVNALYTQNVYTVTFLNEGVQHNKQQVFCGEDATKPADPTKEGHHFTGWDAEFTNVQSNLTINATFEINKYTVTFKDWDGKTLKTQENVEWNTAAAAPADPEREGYDFKGWDIDYSKITKDTTVTATYEIKHFTVRFLNWNDAVLKSETVDWGNDATAPEEDPSREGYTFTGWDKAFTNVKANLDVKAQFEINKFTVTFKDWDGEVLKTQENVEWNTAAIAPADPSRDCHTFTGWAPAFDHVQSNLEVIAQYTKNTYTVIFKDNDGTVLDTQNDVECGSAAIAPADPHHTGYTFTGWDKDFSEVTEDLVVTAVFTPGEAANLNVQFIHESDVLSEKVTTFMIPAAPIIEGYKFIGWRPVANIINDKIQIEAVYEKDSETAAPEVYTNPANPAQKLVRDGNVYILKDGHEYTITGLKVK